jgi:BirA family biotin operon repressor/biotin-[acetyl-CoA-carboxylase] ligase
MTDVLGTEAIRTGLRTRVMGQTVYFWPDVGSTNDELKRLAEAGAPEGSLAIADHQRAGRGRLQRRWEASAGSNLLLSLLFRPTFLVPERVLLLTMLCALAAADAVTRVTGLQPELKWPNDLMLNGKKLAGILTELACDPDGTHLSWVVVGLGLNVNQDFDAWPELAETATSLKLALGRPVPRLPLLQAFLTEVEMRYEALRAGYSPQPEWAARLATLGRVVTVTGYEGTVQGIAEGVDETGALLLRLPDGSQRRVLTGDVSLAH